VKPYSPDLNHGTTTTLIAGLTTAGLEIAMTLDGAVDTAAFERFVEHFLCPALRPGQTVLIDNLSVHEGIRIRAMIEAAGCRLLFLPAYSPEFAPIEHLSPLTNAPLANQRFESLAALETIQAERCLVLQQQPELIRRHTLFHWWPTDA
jgi:transposase